MTTPFALRLILPAIALIGLSACSGAYWPDTYFYPKGYTNLDTTPLSTPHGYSKTPAQEDEARLEIADNADAWRNAVGTVLQPVTGALDMNRPVSVTTLGGFSPLNASAANYTRDMLVKMGYLVALPEEANQNIAVQATAPGGRDQAVLLHVDVSRMGKTVGSNETHAILPYQVISSNRLPGLTTYPAVAPHEPAKPYSNLNQD